MIHPWFTFALIGALCLAACGSRTVSGAYVFSSPNEVVMLQLVESPDGNLSGSLQSASANERHEVRTDSVALSGTIDGDTLTLSTPTFLGMGTTFSGTRSGNEVTLTFTTSGNVNTMAFRRSTPDDFATLTELLREDQRKQQQAAARVQYEVNFMNACQAQGSPRVRCACIWDKIEAEINPDSFAALEQLPLPERNAHPLMLEIQGYARACPTLPSPAAAEPAPPP